MAISPRARLLLALLLSVSGGCQEGARAQKQQGLLRRPPRAALGVNVGEVNYYTPQVVFLDLVKQAQDWGLGNEGKPPAAVDAHGWPTALAPGHVAGFIVNAPEAGPYVALYDGDGEVTVEHGGTVTASKPGRVEMTLQGGETHFKLLRTSATAPLKNLRIVPRANERDYAKKLFHPRFMERLAPFGVLRFLDFLRINGSKLTRWADRPRPDDFSQGTDRGVALEYAIELCNRIRADCWLNVPHLADDEYVRKMAELVREKLDPSLHVYLEYSNEIWNFPHGDELQRRGEAMGMPHDWGTRLRYQAHRSIEIFAVFERALGRERLIRVLAGQMYPERLKFLIEWEKAYAHADVLAVAPYMCGDAGDAAGKVRRLDPGEIAAMCVADVARVRKDLKVIRGLADRYGLALVGYEGGQHLVTGGAQHENAALQRALDEANRHPVMGRAYDQYLEAWREEGGQLLVLYELIFEPSKWGRWGLLERLDQPLERAPKYQAALGFLRRRAPWWGRRVPTQ